MTGDGSIMTGDSSLSSFLVLWIILIVACRMDYSDISLSYGL